MSSKETHGRTWAMVCHLATFAGWIIPFGNILGPLVAWLAEREDHPHINDQGKEAVNFNISITIYGVAAMVVGILGFIAVAAGVLSGVLALVVALVSGVALTIFHFVFTLVAAYRAEHGVNYRYPLTLRFIK